MICLADNDVILKLAAFDLLTESLAALGVTHDSVYVLSEAKHVLGRIAPRHGPEVSARIQEFLSLVKPINWSPPSAELLLFEDTLGIDPGEAVLFASTATVGAFTLTTGDKTSLRALSNSIGCEHIARRLAGRVVCLEQLIERCISLYGFETIKQKILPYRDCDTAVLALFGSGPAASEAGVADGLRSYIADLRTATGGLLTA